MGRKFLERILRLRRLKLFVTVNVNTSHAEHAELRHHTEARENALLQRQFILWDFIKLVQWLFNNWIN